MIELVPNHGNVCEKYTEDYHDGAADFARTMSGQIEVATSVQTGPVLTCPDTNPLF